MRITALTWTEPFRDSLSRLLSEESYTCVSSLEEALEALEGEGPHLLLLEENAHISFDHALPLIQAKNRDAKIVLFSTGSSTSAMLRDILTMEYVHDIIYGHMQRLDEIGPLLSCAGIHIAPHIVLTLIIDDFWRVCAELHNRARYELKRSLLNSARDAMKQYGINGVATTLIGTDKVVVLLNCGARGEQEAEEYAVFCAGQMKHHTSEQTGQSVSIGVSLYCSQPAFLWKAYEQSFQALRGSFHMGKSRVLLYQRRTAREEHKQDLPELQQAKREWIIAISTGDAGRCCRAVDGLLNELFVCHNDEIAIKSYFIVLLSEISQYSIQLGLDAAAVSSQLVSLVGTVTSANTTAEISTIVKRYLANLSETLHRLDAADHAMNIARAYMEQYYKNDLTLQELSKLCGYSPSHFSRCFKEHYGVNFVQYLTQIRIEKAKTLLAETELTIAEITEKIGFQSASYFSNTFKKITGLAPNQFRADNAGQPQ